MTKSADESIRAALETPQKLMPHPFSTTISLSVDILPYVINMETRIDIGIEINKIDGCKYINIFKISLKSAPVPIRTFVILTNFSMKRIMEREKTITAKLMSSSFNIVL